MSSIFQSDNERRKELFLRPSGSSPTRDLWPCIYVAVRWLPGVAGVEMTTDTHRLVVHVKKVGCDVGKMAAACLERIKASSQAFHDAPFSLDDIIIAVPIVHMRKSPRLN